MDAALPWRPRRERFRRSSVKARRANDRRVSRVNTGGGVGHRRTVFEPMACHEEWCREAYASPDKPTSRK
jgi:hypothetical protein